MLARKALKIIAVFLIFGLSNFVGMAQGTEIKTPAQTEKITTQQSKSLDKMQKEYVETKSKILQLKRKLSSQDHKGYKIVLKKIRHLEQRFAELKLELSRISQTAED